MAKPTDLTRKGWAKIKGLTVPKTGFGEKLDAYKTAKDKTAPTALSTRNLVTYKAACDALDDVGKAIPDAQKKCNKTLHKDTIAALEAYKGLVIKEMQVIHGAMKTYQGYIDRYIHLREVCGKEMTAIEKELAATVKKHIDEAKKLAHAHKGPELAKEVKTALAELTRLQKASDDSIAKPRVPGPAVETPHADDRPDASVFTALIDKQKSIIAIRQNAEAELKKLHA